MVATTSNTFKADLKKMLPVTAIILVTAFLVILSLRFVGIWHLERALASGKSSSDYAEIYYVQGWRDTLKIRELAAVDRLEKVGRDSGALDTASLGSIKGDEMLNKAIDNINKALQVDASHKQSHRLMSMLQWYEGNEAQSYIHLAEYYRLGGLGSQALTAYQMALALDPENSEIISGVVFTLLNMKRVDEAWKEAEEKEDLLKSSPRGIYALGYLYGKKGNYTEAETLLREAISQGVMEKDAITQLSLVANALNRHREIADFLMGVGEKTQRTNVSLYHSAAIHYRKVEMLPEEEKALRYAVELFPNSGLLHYELSVNLFQQGKFEDAKREFNVASQYDFEMVMQAVKKSGINPGKPHPKTSSGMSD